MRKTLWLIGIIVIISFIFGTFFVVVQQVLRISANDPQIELAEDTANLLNHGTNPSAYANAPKVDLSTSLAPFVMVYGNDQKLLASSAELSGKAPTLPLGVLQNTSANHENRLTWQPQSGVRLAIVVVKSNGGYVVAGRSLREVEKRESNALNQIMIGWLVTVGFILAWAWLEPLSKTKRRG